MADFGELVDLTASLSSILRRYPFGIGLFREILQNSDDAGATKQIFILDRQSYPTDSLLRPSLQHLQGPSLLAFNDTVFSEDDWNAIRTVSQSSKTADSDKIGKHGLGSRAYYHLTDNPQYLSGQHLAIFDPHRWTFEQGGWRVPLTEVQAQHPDQLVPFRSMLENDGDGIFHSTIVRLALRVSSSPSKISSKAPTPDEIHTLMEKFIEEELELVLLFLSHLSSVEVREINAEGRMQVLATATKISRQVDFKSYDATGCVPNAETIRTTRGGSPTASSDWYIIRTSATAEDCVDGLAAALDDTTEHVRKELDREKLRPDVALAFPQNSLSFNGRLFTFLPLPLSTGFPCHVHGIFSLTDSRQNLRNPSETIMARTADQLAVEWNKLLFSTFVPRTWLAFLVSVATSSLPLDIYGMFPPRQDQNASGDTAYWSSLLVDIVRLALNEHAIVWPVVPRAPGSTLPTYVSFDDVLVASHEDDAEEVRMLIKAGVVIILPPLAIREVLLELRPEQGLSPRRAHSKLKCCTGLVEMQQSEKNTVLNFLLRTNDLESIIDLPVIPLVSGCSTSLQIRGSSNRNHVLHGPNDELFGTLDPEAIKLSSLPVAACKLLVDRGETLLNVNSLNLAQATAYIKLAYIKLASQHFALRRAPESAWSWDVARQWLAQFWEWMSTCLFARDLLPRLEVFPLLPTTANELRSMVESVFLYPIDLTDQQREVLVSVGVHFLHPTIPMSFIGHHQPTIVKNVSSATDLLDVLKHTLVSSVDSDIAEVIRAHLANIMVNIRLSGAFVATLQSLTIHLVLSLNSSTLSTTTTISSIPPDSTIRCILRPTLLSIPLPQLDGSVFVECTQDEKCLIEQIDHLAAALPVSEEELIRLHALHFVQQSPTSRLRVVQCLLRNRHYLTPDLIDKLRLSPIVQVGSGDRWLAPKDVIDPSSTIADLVPPGDNDSIFNDLHTNSEMARALSEIGLLRRDLDAGFVAERIRHIGTLPPNSTAAQEAARLLIAALERTQFNCTGVQYDEELAWIPTTQGLHRPRDCRDVSKKTLCDRVLLLLDMPQPLQSHSLRTLLKWHIPLPIDVLVKQFTQIVSVPTGSAAVDYYLDLTSEFGERWSDLQDSERVSLANRVRSKAWVITESGTLIQPTCAVFDLPSPLHGFGKVSLDILRRPGVKEFLLCMGCSDRPYNSSIIVALRALKQNKPSDNAVFDSVDLLRALDLSGIEDHLRSELVVPGSDGHLHPIVELFYNDIGSRAHHFQLPAERVQVHHIVPTSLCRRLRIASLGSLQLEPLSLDIEDMREDLTTRIQNVLRAYDIGQAFNEFLANAADAGASEFRIILDNDVSRRRAHADEVLCENIAQYCTGPALVVHNNAEFTMDDIRGICRIGRGGKEGREATIGRFGLGSLSFYHFSEVAMILSGSHLMLLDPSGKNLPEDWGRNTYVLPITSVRSLYPGHLRIFDQLCSFNSASDNYYRGTLIRLPLRTLSQASKSSLSTHVLSIQGVRDMLHEYRPIAEKSLFFIGVNEVIAVEVDSGTPFGDAPAIWSLNARRVGPPKVSGVYSLQHVNVALGYTERGRWNTAQSSWQIARSTIDPAVLPSWAPLIVAKHRLKQLSVALAAQISSDGRHGGHASSAHHFFSSLPLPAKTSLPVHLHASFVLADDRRNIRWDGNGSLNEDSQFNHWLLTSQIPPLFLYLLEELVAEFPDTPCPWPARTHHQSDALSSAVISAFYSDDCITSTTRKILRGLTGRTMEPSLAVICGPGEPDVIRELLHHLKLDNVIELPSRVAEKVFKLRVKKVDRTFVCNSIRQQRDQFVAVYQANVTSVKLILQYLFNDLSQPATSLPSNSIIGLPLLPLANGQLSDIARFGSAPTVYTMKWIPAILAPTPWPVFPASRFLHPSLDGNILLRQDLNVASFDSAAVISLLRTKSIPESTKERLSIYISAWIRDFWELFPSLHASIVTLDNLQAFTLVPTSEAGTFISIKYALSPSTIYISPSSPHRRSSFVESLQKLGIVVSQSNCPADTVSKLPPTVISRLEARSLTFTTFIDALHELDRTGALKKSPMWSIDAQTHLATWIRHELSKIPAPPNKKKQKQKYLERQRSFNVLRSLPIWPSYRGGERETLRALTDPNVRILPQTIGASVKAIAPFLTKDLFFVESSSQAISRLSNDGFMSLSKFASCLTFPPSLTQSDFDDHYRPLLDSITHLPSRDALQFSSLLHLPRNDLQMAPISTFYANSVSEFRAAFQYQPQRFVHTKLRSTEFRLYALGLIRDKSPAAFEACCRAIDEDFDKTSLTDRDRAKVVYQWYNTELPVIASVKTAAWWCQLDRHAFVPTRGSSPRWLGDPQTFPDVDFAAKSLPHIVPPSKVVRGEYASIAWTQRALFLEPPDKRLLMVHPTIGIPSVGEVIEHLGILALQIAPKHRQDEDLLSDLLATYKFLAEHKEASQVTQLLRGRRNEALFLNVDDPSEYRWRFCPAAQLMFNVPDDGDYQEARTFLLPFRSLLVAAGAFEFRLVDEPDLVLSPAEEELSGLRAAFDGMRSRKLLTDVVFRAPENAPGSDGPGEVWAHRAFLVTASEYFRDLFSDGFSESGPASVRDPIIIKMETLEEFQCAALVLDHVYTGRLPNIEDRTLLTTLLYLAHRWQMAQVLAKTEVMLVRKIDPWTYQSLREHAQNVDAKTLLDKVDEFERVNAEELRQMTSWSETTE